MKINIGKGVRQRDKSSPKLYPAGLKSMFQKINWEGMNGKYLKQLQFVGDILLISGSTDELLKILNNLNKEGLNIVLIIIRNNTKVKFKCNILNKDNNIMV